MSIQVGQHLHQMEVGWEERSSSPRSGPLAHHLFMSHLALWTIAGLAFRLPLALLLKLLVSLAPSGLVLLVLGLVELSCCMALLYLWSPSSSSPSPPSSSSSSSSLWTSYPGPEPWSRAAKAGALRAATLSIAFLCLSHLPLLECACLFALARPIRRIRSRPGTYSTHASLLLALLALAPLLVPIIPPDPSSPLDSPPATTLLPRTLLILLGSLATLISTTCLSIRPDGPREAISSSSCLILYGLLLCTLYHLSVPSPSQPWNMVDGKTIAALLTMALVKTLPESWSPSASSYLSLRLPGHLTLLDLPLWAIGGLGLLGESLDRWRALSLLLSLFSQLLALV
ncbi:MAG: hypothetical protein DHS80DRAFT_26390 [Piptocephalis tieghemiana]|nr:MAG: hypothetical protein DHS80DRAFT_26390 [Piptocephalis tieghemiana]